jgi:hypothetical protein
VTELPRDLQPDAIDRQCIPLDDQDRIMPRKKSARGSSGS